MTGSCSYCDEPATHRHHPTARPAGKEPYFDPDLVLPLCLSCHLTDHAAWRYAEIDVVTDPIVTRLRRLAFTFARLADRGGSLPSAAYAPIALCLATLAFDVETRP